MKNNNPGQRALRELSVASDVDPRTLRRYFDGDEVREASVKRIEAVLREKGMKEWLRKG